MAHAHPEPATPVSVIIVNYNAGSVLSECVQRVLASDTAVAVWVVDNASHDDSLAQLRQAVPADPRLQIYPQTRNLGFARASNLALPAAQGEYLLFLNPDCYVETDTVSRMRSIMDAHPGAGLGGVLVCNPDGSEQVGCRRRVPSPGRALVRVLHLDRWWPSRFGSHNFVLGDAPLPTEPTVVEGISGAFMWVRRSALATVGPLDEGYFLHCEDLDWFMRFRQAGWDILFVPEVKVTHFKGLCSEGEPLRVSWHKHRGMLRYYRKFFRQRYPLPLSWLVTGAVWARFALLALISVVKRAFRFNRR